MTGITLSEAWQRMAKAPRPPLRAGLSPNPAAFARDHHYRLRCPSGKSRLRLVQCARQKYSASPLPQITPTTPAIPHPLEGRIAIVTDVGRGMRWTRQRRARTGSQGGPWSVSEQAGAQTDGA